MKRVRTTTIKLVASGERIGPSQPRIKSKGADELTIRTGAASFSAGGSMILPASSIFATSVSMGEERSGVFLFLDCDLFGVVATAVAPYFGSLVADASPGCWCSLPKREASFRTLFTVS